MSKSTPEGIVKDLVKTMLQDIGCCPASKSGEINSLHHGWYYMPVQNGMGVTSIPDFLGNYMGKFFAVETKAPRKKPTARQQMHIDAISKTHGLTFVIDSKESVEECRRTLLEMNNER
jgi:hypothetical protein